MEPMLWLMLQLSGYLVAGMLGLWLVLSGLSFWLTGVMVLAKRRPLYGLVAFAFPPIGAAYGVYASQSKNPAVNQL